MTNRLIPLLLAVVAGQLIAEEGSKISFPVESDQLEMYVEAKFQGSAPARYLHIELIKDKASCCHGALGFEVVIQTPTQSVTAPFEMSDTDVSTSRNFRIGKLEITELRLKLVHAQLKRKIKARLYTDIVATDRKCMNDAIDAMAEGGLAGRKKIQGLLDVKCISEASAPMFVDSVDGIRVFRARKIGTAFLFPADLDATEHEMLSGWIFADRLHDGVRTEYYTLQESPISAPISIVQ